MSTYLIIDIATISIPFIAGFHPKISFHHKWKSLFPSITIAALIFLVWDYYFTEMGIWGFNPTHLLGIKILNLPLEEILFFICIPYASVFTYYCLKEFTSFKLNSTITAVITFLFAALLIVTFFLTLSKWYTALSCSLTAYFLIYQFIVDRELLSRFYISYLVIFCGPFLIVNGLLTGMWLAENVVWYKDLEILGIRVITIPLEDFVYGFLLFLLNVHLFEFFNKSQKLQTTTE